MSYFKDIPGPGDPETWGPCTGNPMDPRYQEEDDEYEPDYEEIIESEYYR